ncbi:MAG: ABC transporter ATP-binding protein [Ignavibacteria bacterium GWB2_35_12]|nr:MAG: ABC transporter ATP-binding protein [Ignavibacteria bacterium GWA2_35_8]OGU40012.1 MAG: ABC transporter ATP-binding protein [Ignavibacteria bacterium GWB2_35_12]OGU86931.1 MAG: ABC transporter ATP-binding protein [Ignavibacteria bacterium RIFOXYA2_FULL_35_10]OGV21974.1 MAG: ABC transporter ATP-binding protein [Ignavibacteria bacterium RIFOXYC2_FULL_35_21]
MNDIVIEIKNLFVNFARYSALENLNLSIPGGSFVSVVGPNGAGKTTFLKVILGLLKPNQGSITILGKQTDELSPFDLGYVPQVKTLDRSFPAMPIELVSTGLKAKWPGKMKQKDKKPVMEILEKVGAGNLAKRPLNKLSGGELQRVYLARALIRKPKILVLDEPATGIDWIGENDIHKIIDDYKSEFNATIIMVTHDWEAAYHHADHVLMLNRHILCFDTPDKAFTEQCLRQTFGHVGHRHEMIFVGRHHD